MKRVRQGRKAVVKTRKQPNWSAIILMLAVAMPLLTIVIRVPIQLLVDAMLGPRDFDTWGTWVTAITSCSVVLAALVCFGAGRTYLWKEVTVKPMKSEDGE